jgi:hypothetical protein
MPAVEFCSQLSRRLDLTVAAGRGFSLGSAPALEPCCRTKSSIPFVATPFPSRVHVYTARRFLSATAGSGGG